MIVFDKNYEQIRMNDEVFDEDGKYFVVELEKNSITISNLFEEKIISFTEKDNVLFDYEKVVVIEEIEETLF